MAIIAANLKDYSAEALKQLPPGFSESRTYPLWNANYLKIAIVNSAKRLLRKETVRFIDLALPAFPRVYITRQTRCKQKMTLSGHCKLGRHRGKVNAIFRRSVVRDFVGKPKAETKFVAEQCDEIWQGTKLPFDELPRVRLPMYRSFESRKSLRVSPSTVPTIARSWTACSAVRLKQFSANSKCFSWPENFGAYGRW